MIFHDRIDAGRKLAAHLMEYKGQPDCVVLGLPRGGAIVAYEVASALDLPLDVVVVRKVGAPHNEEMALGAINEAGTGIFNEDMIRSLHVSQSYLKETIAKEQKLANLRASLYRAHRSPVNLKGKTCIIVDDGIATGATIKVAINAAKAEGAKYIVAAAPVGPPEALHDVGKMCDKVVAAYAPTYFGAVGAFYQLFGQTDDSEVQQCLDKQRRRIFGGEGQPASPLASVASIHHDKASAAVDSHHEKSCLDPATPSGIMI